MKNRPIVPLRLNGLAPRLGLALVLAAFPVGGRSAETEMPEAAVRSAGLVSHATQAIAARQGVVWIGCDGRQLLLGGGSS
jgi:hypothetical protein